MISLDGVNNLAYPYYLFKELEIPFSVVVDKDFFFDYKNEEFEKSRSKSGLPEYKNEITNIDTKRKIIDNAFDNIESLEQAKGYREFFKLIESKNFYSMMYCLEIDLICSSKAREIYYKHLNIPEENQKLDVLLLDNKKAIKRRENILKVMSELPLKNYPESFKKIRNAIIEELMSQEKQNL